MERLIITGRVVPKAAGEIKKSRIGIGFEKLDRNVFDPEKAYDSVAALGVKFVRIQSGWQRTEKEKGVYDFAWIDSIVDNLISRGLTPWICLCYGNKLYTEAAGKVFGAVGCPPIFTQEERMAWCDYVTMAAAHFAGRVIYYEVWNEPDGIHCWKHGVSAGEYAAFCIDTAKAVHAGDPSAKVIGGATCSINLPYTADLLRAGIAEYIDAFSFHRYQVSETDAARDIKALRALLDRYAPWIGIIQGESGGQSSSRGAGALHGGAWSNEKQAKHLLRQRMTDLSSTVIFTSHFTTVDMIEALNGVVTDKQSYQDYGYFGVISADFDEDGFSTGEYSPKPAYFALQTLCALFAEDLWAADLPIKRCVLSSPRIFGNDFNGDTLQMAGFEKNGMKAFAYWNASDLMTTDFESTVSFEAAYLDGDIRLIDLMNGIVYCLPVGMVEKRGAGCLLLRNLPVRDYPLLLTFGSFADNIRSIDKDSTI
jgi:polysaccharide biosynthesis protein PslG